MKPDKNPKAWSDVAGACHTSPLLEIITSSQWKRSFSRHFSASISSTVAQQKPQPFGGKLASPARLSLCETSTQARGMIPILRKFPIARLLDAWTRNVSWKSSVGSDVFPIETVPFFGGHSLEFVLSFFVCVWKKTHDICQIDRLFSTFFFPPCSFNDLEKIQLESRGNTWGRPGTPNNQFVVVVSIGWFQINIKNGWKSRFPSIKNWLFRVAGMYCLQKEAAAVCRNEFFRKSCETAQHFHQAWIKRPLGEVLTASSGERWSRFRGLNLQNMTKHKLSCQIHQTEFSMCRESGGICIYIYIHPFPTSFPYLYIKSAFR